MELTTRAATFRTYASPPKGQQASGVRATRGEATLSGKPQAKRMSRRGTQEARTAAEGPAAG